MPLPDDQIVQKYINNLPPSDYRGPLFVIGFIGGSGAGKSTLARKLGEEFNVYVADNDYVRRFLNQEGYEGGWPRQDLVEQINHAVTEYLFEKNLSHIIDADLIKFHHAAKERADKHGAKFFLIHIFGEEEDILNRLEKRGDEQNSFAKANQYFYRKGLHEGIGIPEVFYTFKSSEDWTLQLEELVGLIKKELSI